MDKKSHSINLLKNKELSLFTKTVNWTLTIGRLVVILTEIIALSAFIYRFSLDRRVIDLHSKIKQELTVVSYFKNNEEKFRNLQDRLALASSFSNKAQKTAKILPDIVSFAPYGITFHNLSIYPNRVNISGSAAFPSALNTFVQSLKNYTNVKSVSLDNIETRPSGNISVSLTAKFLEDNK